MADATPGPAPMYELMYIINPVLNEDQTKEIVQRVTAYLADSNAQIESTNEMGSQRLAYPIEKKRNGYYVVVNFRLASPDLLPKLERALQINDDIHAPHGPSLRREDAPPLPGAEDRNPGRGLTDHGRQPNTRRDSRDGGARR